MVRSYPKFDGDPFLAIAHIIDFTEFVSCLGIEHEDVIVRLVLLFLEEKQRVLIKHYYNPKSISSPMVLIQ
jgi:hypothetical protein